MGKVKGRWETQYEVKKTSFSTEHTWRTKATSEERNRCCRSTSPPSSQRAASLKGQPSLSGRVTTSTSSMSISAVSSLYFPYPIPLTPSAKCNGAMPSASRASSGGDYGKVETRKSCATSTTSVSAPPRHHLPVQGGSASPERFAIPRGGLMPSSRHHLLLLACHRIIVIIWGLMGRRGHGSKCVAKSGRVLSWRGWTLRPKA